MMPSEQREARVEPLRAEKTELMQKLAKLALDQLLSVSQVDPEKVGVIGFCFGGAMALNLGRAGGKHPSSLNPNP